MNLQEKLTETIKNLQDQFGDLEKTEKGNASAGTRVRKSLMIAINALKDLRKEILEARKNK